MSKAPSSTPTLPGVASCGKNGGDPRACGTGVNYLRVCQSVEGAVGRTSHQSSPPASARSSPASGIGSKPTTPAIPTRSSVGSACESNPSPTRSGARVLILHSPVAPSGIIRHGASSGAELLAGSEPFKTMLYRQPDPFTPEQILLLRRIESALLETLNLTKSRLT